MWVTFYGMIRPNSHINTVGYKKETKKEEKWKKFVQFPFKTQQEPPTSYNGSIRMVEHVFVQELDY